MMKQIIFMLTFILFSSILSNVFAQVSVEWEQNYGGSEKDVIVDTKQTSDGGFIIAGHTYSSDGDISVSYGSSDYWLVKTDVLGSIEWEQSYGTNALQSLKCFDETSDGGFILVGNSGSNSSDDGDCFIVKTDALGNVEWENNYHHQYVINTQSPERVVSCHQTSDGGFVITGNGLSYWDIPDENYWAFK